MTGTSGSEQAEAYNRVEKLRDPSHVRALSLAELTGLSDGAGLRGLRTAFFKAGDGVGDAAGRIVPEAR
jgi:hypothetical protein